MNILYNIAFCVAIIIVIINTITIIGDIAYFGYFRIYRLRYVLFEITIASLYLYYESNIINYFK